MVDGLIIEFLIGMIVGIELCSMHVRKLLKKYHHQEDKQKNSLF